MLFKVLNYNVFYLIFSDWLLLTWSGHNRWMGNGDKWGSTFTRSSPGGWMGMNGGWIIHLPWGWMGKSWSPFIPIPHSSAMSCWISFTIHLLHVFRKLDKLSSRVCLLEWLTNHLIDRSIDRSINQSITFTQFTFTQSHIISHQEWAYVHVRQWDLWRIKGLMTATLLTLGVLLDIRCHLLSTRCIITPCQSMHSQPWQKGQGTRSGPLARTLGK